MFERRLEDKSLNTGRKSNSRSDTTNVENSHNCQTRQKRINNCGSDQISPRIEA